MNNKTWLVIGSVGLAALVGGGAFFGGMAFERTRAQNAQAAFFAARGGRPAGNDGGFPRNGAGFPGGAGGGVIGTVKSVEGDTLTVSTAQDVTAVVLTETTTISKQVPGDRSDLQPGWQVTVRGERDSKGVVTAVTIQVLGEARAP